MSFCDIHPGLWRDVKAVYASKLSRLLRLRPLALVAVLALVLVDELRCQHGAVVEMQPRLAPCRLAVCRVSARVYL